jgi:tetratricopeptide (TPR) repeat protein
MTDERGEEGEAIGETALVVAAGESTGEESRLTPLRAAGDPLELAPGTRLGRYVVVRRIGRGGMGTVYAAYDPELDRNLALKLVTVAGEGSVGDEGRARLLREAQAIGGLSHPNVVAVHDVGVHGNHVVIAMEHVEGTSLRAWLAEPRPWREVLPVFLQASRGLQAAHRAGLVHRDFKPDNVLLGTDGRVRVADFGLARAAGGPAPAAGPAAAATQEADLDLRLTLTGTTLGTPAYMSPEQHRCDPVDARSDQFSFCVALWEGLFGRRPFSGKTLADLARQTAHGEIDPPPPRRRVPRRIRRALERGLSPDPAARFPSMAALARELRRPLRRRGLTRLALAGAMVAALAAAFAWSRAPAPAAPACEAAAARERLRGAWDGDVRERIDDVVSADGRAWLGETWSRASEVLDAQAEAWVAAHVDACEATNVRFEDPQTWLEGRMECLDRRRDELARLTTRLAGGDEDTLFLAGQLVHELVPVSSCADGSGAVEDAPSPERADLREIVDAERARLAQARDMLEAKHAERARVVAREVLARAQEIGFDPLAAEALVFLAPLEELLDHDPVRAAQLLHEGAGAALRGGHDRAAARAWVGLARNAGERGELAEGHRWAEYAARVLVRRPDPALEVGLAGARTWLGILGKDDPAALAAAQRGLEVAERELGPEHPQVIAALNNVSIAHYYGHRKDEALVYLQRALGLAEKVHGPNHPTIAIPLNNMGVILTDQSRYAEAIGPYERALRIREATLDERHPNVLQSHDNLAELLYRDRQWARAEPHAARAVALAEAGQAPAETTIKALRRHGTILAELGRDGQALVVFERALALAESRRAEDRPLVAACRFDLARSQWRAGDRKAGRAGAKVARDLFGQAGPEHDEAAQAVRRWLAQPS